MKQTEQRQEPPFRLENGQKIYRLRNIVNCAPRQVQQPGKPPKTTNLAAAPAVGTEVGDAGASEPSPGQSTDNPDELRVLTRLISSVPVWCWNTYYGPMYVDFSYNGGMAIRQVPDLINSARRPVPVMWNHTDDIRLKAGRVMDAYWEESSDIAPGANGYLVINRKYDPKAAMGLELGELDATSLGMDCDKVQSHPDMDFWTFMDLQGKVVDGIPVAWWPIATRGVYHHALVTAGADPDSGPREEQTTMKDAASAVDNNKIEGGTDMEETWLGLLSVFCAALGVDTKIMAGQAPPADLEKRCTDRLTTLNSAFTGYNDLASKLQAMALALLKEGETTLSAADVLNRLPERIELAKHGEAFLKNQQETALAWFDKARVDPQNKDSLTDVNRRRRERIANSTDLQFLADEIDTYQAEAKSKFGKTVNLRVTEGEELQMNQTETADPPDVDRLLNSAMMDRFMPRPKQGGNA